MALPKLPRLPKLPGQKEPPTLFPPVFPRTTIPTPFGSVNLPEYKITPPRLPTFDAKSWAAMKHAIAIDGAMVPAMIPVVGDVVADVVEDLHFAELRNILSPGDYNEFIKHDKVAPATLAMVRTLAKQ